MPIINGGGAGGGVGSVAATDASIVVAGTATAPTVATGTLDVIASTHAPVAAVALNAKKITGLANGTAATDAAAFGQIPTALGLAIFGDGSDGSPTFDGSTVILGVTPSSNTYTQNRDWFLSSPTINNGVSIITNGFRIFVSGTLTNNGTIQWNGKSPGSSATGGAALTNTNSTLNNSVTGALAPGTKGGNAATGAGTAGTNGTVAGFGGVGGTGGTGTGGAGAAGGTQTAPTATQGSVRAFPFSLGIPISGAQAIVQFQGGTGGGSGGGDSTNSSGSGAGGGGLVIVAAAVIAGTGVIQARGGDGGTATAGNVGGGGGGGGGLVIVVSSSVSAGAIAGQTIDANGGLKGSPHGTGSDNATAGGNGTAVILRN